MADSTEDSGDMREKASDTDVSPPNTPDISKFMSMSDFRVDFSKRRKAVFIVTGYLGLLAGVITGVLLYCIIVNVHRGQPVDPTVGNIMSGLVTALFINVAAVIGGYLIVPAWESSNFRKNFGDVMKTLSDSNTQRTAMRHQPRREE